MYLLNLWPCKPMENLEFDDDAGGKVAWVLGKQLEDTPAASRCGARACLKTSCFCYPQLSPAPSGALPVLYSSLSLPPSRPVPHPSLFRPSFFLSFYRDLTMFLNLDSNLWAQMVFLYQPPKAGETGNTCLHLCKFLKVKLEVRAENGNSCLIVSGTGWEAEAWGLPWGQPGLHNEFKTSLG